MKKIIWIILITMMVISPIYASNTYKFVISENEENNEVFSLEQDVYIVSNIDKNINFKIGKGYKDILLIISPSCSHCQNLMKELTSRKKLLNTYKFHIVLIDFKELIKDKQKMTTDYKYISYLKNHHSLKELGNLKNLDISKQKINKKLKNQIEKNIKIIKGMGVQSFPTIIEMETGKIINVFEIYSKDKKVRN